ncbi:hypothetical protein, partial [Deinococcus ruber]|uniref:hypothetical protein n=1 Tax=Deinococcus ruber TaxID=1848197 RepID=UPI001667FF6F
MSAPPNLSLRKLALQLGISTAGKSQDQLAAAIKSAVSAASGRRVITSFVPYNPSSSIIRGETVIGVDTVAGAAYYRSATNLYRSTDFGATISSALSLPAVTSPYTVGKIVRWNGFLWCIGRDATTNNMSVYRATPTTGNTPLVWSGPLLAMNTGTSGFGFGPSLSEGDALYLYVAEYGLPSLSGGGRVFRLPATDSAGTAWQTILGPLTGTTHIHAVNPDTKNPGHLWVTLGDGVAACVKRSTDYGSTWTDMVSDSRWQTVQISFDANYVYLAPDVTYNSLVVYNRATGAFQIGASAYHAYLPVLSPGVFFDAGTTSASTTLTMKSFVTSAFDPTDVGRAITGQNIPAGTTIAAYTNAYQVTLSQAATATLSGGYIHIQRPERWNANCFLGAVDESVGAYYFAANDN